jgi:Uma2 family endonuclease
VEWIEDQGLGEVFNAPMDVVLDQHNVVQPDLLFISKERLGVITKPNIQGAPDLVVEILSPSTAEWDRATKRRAYEKYGVQELWVVDPEGQTIEVAARKEARLETIQVYPRGTTMVSPVLPGFALDVDHLFR